MENASTFKKPNLYGFAFAGPLALSSESSKGPSGFSCDGLDRAFCSAADAIFRIPAANPLLHATTSSLVECKAFDHSEIVPPKPQAAPLIWLQSLAVDADQPLYAKT